LEKDIISVGSLQLAGDCQLPANNQEIITL